jgi:hypothetical protein
MSLRTIAIVRPRNPSTGAVQTVRLGGGGTSPLLHDGQHYRAGIARSPRFASRLGIEDGEWTGGTLPTTAALIFAPPQPELLAELAGLYWPGASIELRAGPEDGVLAGRLTGTVAGASVGGGRLQLTIADLSAGVDKPVVTARFAGTGGIEGISEAAGRIKRRSWGRVFNVEGRILDKANNIYEFGDPARSMQGFDALRDKGNAGSIVGLAWQGSSAATLAALQAAAAPAGGGVVAPSIACVKWWTQPSLLTADLRGETAGGYAEDVIGIASRVLASVAGPGIANATAAAVWRPGAAGIHISDDNETAAQALDRLFLGASLLWVLDTTGAVNVRQIGFADPIETLRPTTSTRQRQLKPVRSYRVGYRRNQRQHNDGELAAVLRGSDVTYSDNTPIDALQPAESGANKTETRTAAAIVGQAPTATSSDFAVVTGATKPANNATVGAVVGANLFESLGGPTLTIEQIKTALGVAASIAGQGSLATQNTAQWLTQIAGAGKPESYSTRGPNLIFNGDAEQGTTDGWASVESNSGVFYLSPGNAITGSAAFRMDKPALANFVAWGTRAVPVSPGKAYRLFLRLYHSTAESQGLYVRIQYRETPPPGGFVNVDNRDGVTDFIANGPTVVYGRDLEFPWVAPANAKWATISVYSYVGGPVHTVIDEVVFAEQIPWGAGISGQGSGKPEDYATLGATAGTNLFENPGGSVLALAAIKTILGTAAGFTGQGALATKNVAGAADISVGSLSAIAADLGIITAGLLRSPTSSTQLDLNNNRLLFNNGSVMLVAGVGFGSAGQFIMWFGPTQANYAACTEANATFYLKTNGAAYFGGTLSAGLLRTSVTTTALAPGANVSTGTIGSNGGTRTVVVSYTWEGRDAITGACPAPTYPSATITIRRGTTVIGTLNIGPGTWSCNPGAGPSEPGNIKSGMGGSTTLSDTTGGTSASYSATISSRTTGASDYTQTLSLTVTEG